MITMMFDPATIATTIAAELGGTLTDLTSVMHTAAYRVWNATWQQGGTSTAVTIRLYSNIRGDDESRTEAAALRALLQAGYVVPELYLHVDSPALCGLPFIVRERLVGQSLSEIIQADPASAPTWVDQTSALLARMHAISIQDGFDYFQPALAPLDFAERQVKWWHKAAQINDATEAFDGFTWLRLNLYQARQSMAATVVHRYFHLDNVIANEDHINGVIHWGEMTLADPAIDVAWARMKIATELTPALGDRFAEAYARRVEQPLAAQPFWEVFAACKRLTELAQSRKSVRGGGETEEGTTMLPVDYEAKLARVTQFMRERLTDEE